MSRPVYIGGVDGSSKGTVVRGDGNFKDLGRVGLCRQAAANILSKAEMVDAGHHTTYVNDECHLDGQGVTVVFKRKPLGSDGQNPTPILVIWAHDSLFPVTVQDNIRRYTPREVGQAQHARELMSWLSFPSSQSLVELIQSGGIMNSVVTAQVVRNPDANYEMSLQSEIKEACLYCSSCVARSTRDSRAAEPRRGHHVHQEATFPRRSAGQT
jgi:hypothetical protein